MKHKFLLLIFFGIFCLQVNARFVDSLGYILPVEHPIKLSGNYMELRKNHFHSGIDIKSSKGKSGDPILCVHDGYISRIKIQSGGYGQALYIDHPKTGHTSVYAHLEKFSPEIEAYIKDVQYTLESFEVDVYLPDSLLQLRKGAVIGTMGNTGRSFGPHLHFEIRETQTELPLNPEFFGFGPDDHKNPVIRNLMLYQLDSLHSITKRTIYEVVSHPNNEYVLKVPLESNEKLVGFGIDVYDQMDGSFNKNGIYKYALYADDKLQIEWQADTFSFSESRMINGFLDYKWLQQYSAKIYKLFTPFCNGIGYFEGREGDGLINLELGKYKKVEIYVYDLYENVTKLSFSVRQSKEQIKAVKSLEDCDTPLSYNDGIFYVNFEPEQFFSPTEIAIAQIEKTIDNKKCSGISVGSRIDPVLGYYKINSIQKFDDKRWCLIAQDSKQRWVNFGGQINGDTLSCEVDALGEFFVYHDIHPPIIEPISFDMSSGKPWRIRIYDNLIPDGKLPDLMYFATINDKWIRMKYDLKSDLLYFEDFNQLPKGQLKLKLIVVDHQGNKSQLMRQIYN